MLLMPLLIAALFVAARTVAKSEGAAGPVPSGGASSPSSTAPKPPPQAPATPHVTATDVQRTAAESLIRYLVQQKGRDKNAIKKLQTAMGGLTADGIVGHLTRERAEKLVGHQIIWPPDIYDPLKEMLGQPQSQPSPANDSAPSSAVAMTKKPAAKKPPPPPGKQPASAAAPAHSVNDAQTAAHDLVAYVQSGGADRAMVGALQRRMAVDPDGIVGPKTKARAEQLLGAKPDWPAAIPPKGPAPAPSSPADAAAELKRYLDTGGKAKSRVAAYQKAMGGVTADGIAGPKTKARIAELLS